MSNYSKGKIYKIVCHETDEVYYGSTIYKYLSSRLAKHKSTRTCKSKQIIDRGNYSIILVENYPCENRTQLETKERYYIENNVCINKYIPTRTQQEYCLDNRDRVREIKKKWNENNRDRVRETQKKWYQNNRDRILSTNS